MEKDYSAKPGKTRKGFHQMPLHLRHATLSATLAKELRKETGRRSVPVRTGDTVEVMRGTHKKKSGKISKVEYLDRIVFIEGINTKKADGKELPVAFHPSRLRILLLDREDERRLKRAGQEKGKEPGERKPSGKTKEAKEKRGESEPDEE